MGIKRYELSEAQWERVAPLLPGKAGDPGRTAEDNRLFVNAVPWVLRSGARWSDLPERYGKYKSVHKRFTRWARAGVWDRLFAARARDRDNEYLMIDSAIVRAHAQAATGQKRGCQAQALGRSRGGLTSKWHLVVDGRGRSVRFLLTAGQASDAANALALLDGLEAAHVIADKAYDTHAILDHVEAIGAKPIIPQRSCMTRKRAFDPGLCKMRNRIERTIGRLKQFRRIATRYDRLPENYRANLLLASVTFWC